MANLKEEIILILSNLTGAPRRTSQEGARRMFFIFSFSIVSRNSFTASVFRIQMVFPRTVIPEVLKKRLGSVYQNNKEQLWKNKKKNETLTAGTFSSPLHPSSAPYQDGKNCFLCVKLPESEWVNTLSRNIFLFKSLFTCIGHNVN